MQRWFTLIGLLLIALLAACAPSGNSPPGTAQPLVMSQPAFLFFYTNN
jgi:hypothetical protein